MTLVTLDDALATDQDVALADDAGAICGCLEWIGSSNGYGQAAVRAVGSGTFRWVFARAGRIIAISDYQTVVAGDERQATAGADVQISITCD
jgi:hypothetical protein